MRICAHVHSSQGIHQVTLRTNENEHQLQIPPRNTGFGSSANGGELLFLALATCYCNDIYREATKRGIQVQDVKVEVEGDFGAEGEPARNVTYHAEITAQAGEDQIRALALETDRVAEIQNTLRIGTPIILKSVETITV